VKRRNLLGAVGAALAGTALPLKVYAQQSPRLPLVGIFGSVPAEIDGFYRGMRELGYTEGQNVAYARGRLAEPLSVRQLLELRPTVVVTAGGVTGVRAVQSADDRVPIVAPNLSDAVETGLAASLAHPGGHVTGLSVQNAELAAKRLEVLHDAFPELRRIAVFGEPEPDAAATAVEGLTAAIRKAAGSLNMQLQVLELIGPQSFDAAFAAAGAAHAEAAINIGGRYITPNRDKFLALAAQYRLPIVCHQSVLSRSGCLMSYGPSFPDLWRRAAGYVDKILRGAKPADLPIEQPTRFELIINLKTAKALGLTVPQSILARADDVIE